MASLARRNNLWRVISGLKKTDIKINRKMLADLAVREPDIFTEIVKTAMA